MKRFSNNSSTRFACSVLACRDETVDRLGGCRSLVGDLQELNFVSKPITSRPRDVAQISGPVDTLRDEGPGRSMNMRQSDVLTAFGIAGVELMQVEVEGQNYFIPPLFGVVEDGLFRCGYPSPQSFPFLKNLHLRTVINLLDRLPDDYAQFLQDEGIMYVHCPVRGNKTHCEEMDRARVRQALALIMDVRRHPLLVHCRSGKHRTGALIGCLRMLQAWDLECACDEYIVYCQHKQREVDKQYIERYDPRTLAALAPPQVSLAAWLSQDACTRPSALQTAIDKGLITPAQAAAGLRVSAIHKGPDEPGWPFSSPQPLALPLPMGNTGLTDWNGAGSGSGFAQYAPFSRAEASYGKSPATSSVQTGLLARRSAEYRSDSIVSLDEEHVLAERLAGQEAVHTGSVSCRPCFGLPTGSEWPSECASDAPATTYEHSRAESPCGIPSSLSETGSSIKPGWSYSRYLQGNESGPLPGSHLAGGGFILSLRPGMWIVRGGGDQEARLEQLLEGSCSQEAGCCIRGADPSPKYEANRHAALFGRASALSAENHSIDPPTARELCEEMSRIAIERISERRISQETYTAPT